MAMRLKVVVIDDDPTGSQTVHSCPLLLRWDAASLRQGLAHASPLLFLLANTRALDPAAARQRVQEICRALRPALAAAQADGLLDQWLVVSRGDSTLRGHFPLELDVIRQELGSFGLTLLAPAFLPGGRTTVGGVHLLHGQPVHSTPFARDRLFGFRSSHLPAWVEEKTQGAVRQEQVGLLGLAELDAAAEGLEPLCHRLEQLAAQPMVAVDAERPEQLQALGAALRQQLQRGQRPLIQSAASLINGLVPLPPQPLDPGGLAALRRPLPGLVLVGSHVPLADQQLQRLLAEPGCAAVEIAVPELAELLETADAALALQALEQSLLQRLRAALAQGCTPVLFSSRGEVLAGDPVRRRRLGLELAALMARLGGSLAPQLGYLISKGGITSHTLLADGLGAGAVELQGQLLPGLSLVLAGALPVLTFPGNLGDDETLRQAWRLMEGSPEAAGPTPTGRLDSPGR
jgi:uncharacterized protein YgbK (DUF1537 family)